MRVLITNGSLGHIAGTQAYVRDLATWLLDRGHSPIVYAPNLGDTATQLRKRTVPVTDDLNTIGAPPDIIHGNSAVETMTALLHFQNAPAIFVCHAWRGALAKPPRFPRILRYVAVDDTCADRLLYEEGIQSTVILNAVDLMRFARRLTALPPKPQRALVFGNTAHAATHLGVILDACDDAGIKVDVIGESAGTAVDEPEELLRGYDLVFAKAKCALEAMASGTAVILCDVAGLGGMVRSEDIARLRRINFGVRALSEPWSAEAVHREIRAYDAADAMRVVSMIRATASADAMHEQLVALYEDVLAQKFTRDVEAEGRAAAAFLRNMNRGGDEAKLNLVVQATHRLLDAPLIGPALTRGARWLVRRGRKKVR